MILEITVLTREERRCRSMYIDEAIVLREDLPEGLQRDFAELREYYDAGDWS